MASNKSRPPHANADQRDISTEPQIRGIANPAGDSRAAQSSLQHTERILETISDAYFTIDRSYCIGYMNRAAEQLLGQPRADLIGRPVEAMFPGDTAAALLRRYRQAIEEARPIEFEEYLPARQLWVEVRVFPNEDGGLTVYQRDISRRKQAEQRLRMSEERLRLLNENVQDYAIMLTDPQGIIIDWNVGSERMFGYTADEMLGRTAERIFTPEDIARGVPAQELNTARTEGRAMDERWHIRRDGTRLWASGVMTPLRDEAGVLRGFVKLARDRTERVQAEEAMRASEERLRIALDAAQMGTWDWNIASGQIVWSGQHYLMFGRAASDSPETFDAFIDVLVPEDRELVRLVVEHALAKQGRFRMEYRVIWPDGSVHWIASEGQVVHDAAGQPSRLSGVITNITERKAAEAELRRAHEELEQRVHERTGELEQAMLALQEEVAERIRAEQARKQLLRQLVTAEEEERKRISRELHDQMAQQITGLLLGLQAVKNSTHEPALLQMIEQQQALVEQLSHEVHRLALQLRPPSLDDLGLAAALANDAEHWSRQLDIPIAFHSSGLEIARLPPAIETAVYRVVLEALTNAVKHAQPRQISIIIERRDGHVSAIVEDNGIGFDAESALGLLQTYQRLGLLGMQERLAQVNGRLTIESAPAAGTTVYIHVPLGEEQPTG